MIRKQLGRSRAKLQTPFSHWIDKQKSPLNEREVVAKRLHVTRQYIDRLCRGELPSLEMAFKIFAFTKQRIGLAAWFEKNSKRKK